MSTLFPEKVLSVGCTDELIRIMRLPRRTRTQEELEDLARQLTEAYRVPGGTMELRPVQAETLFEIGTLGGAFCPQSCGAGKTISSLLEFVANSERPLLVVPAKLLSKTERDRRALSRHFVMPGFLRTMTYEWLGRPQAADALDKYNPDFVGLDEAHFAKNIRGAAVARRLHKYAMKKESAHVKWAVYSGTLMKRSILDSAHLIMWCLRDGSPVPRKYQDLELWADALDERKGQTKRADPGYLEMLCNEEELKIWAYDRRTAARSAFRRRLVETPGVIATAESAVDATLTLVAVEPKLSAIIEEAFKNLRKSWVLPDGKKMMDGLEHARHARELALGFYYHWEPWPPRDWVEKRKRWSKRVREVLKHSRKWDSASQVRKAYPTDPALLEWIAVEKTFVPNTVPVWLDDSVLEFCADWAKREKGIIWTSHITVGQRLEKDFGITYYGKRGRDARKRFIEDHPKGEPMVASIKSNSEGRNLQTGWSTALVTAPPPNGKEWEQLLGRLHREGQESDQVQFDVVCTCVENIGAIWQGVADARFVKDTMGSPQKILLAGLDVPTADEIVFRRGPRWNRGRGDADDAADTQA